MARDFFLKLDPKVEGESLDDKHKGEIDIESYSWGVTNAGSAGQGGGSGAGKASAQDLHMTKKIDKSSPRLMLACATGEHFKTGLLTIRKAGGKQEEYFKVALEDILVSSYQTGASSGSDELPTDQFTLNIGKVKFSYSPQKVDGSLGAADEKGYDFTANKKM